VDYLTTFYNDSLILTYNLASGGATVDSTLVRPYADTVLSIQDQVEENYLPKYGDADFWDPSSTLFAFWIGINDVGNAYGWSNNTSGEVFDSIFSQYSQSIDKVVRTGARNFVLLNLPPVQKTPLTSQQAATNPEIVPREEAAVKDWNNRIDTLASDLQEKNPGVTTMVFDSYSVFSKVLDNPGAYTQTAGYKNLTGYCTLYEKYISLQATRKVSRLTPVTAERLTHILLHHRAASLLTSISGSIHFTQHIQCTMSSLLS